MSGTSSNPGEQEGTASSWRTRLERTVDERRDELRYQRSLAGKLNALNEEVEKWELEQEAAKDASSENKNELSRMLQSKKKKSKKPPQDESITRQLKMEREQEASSKTRNTLSAIRKALSMTEQPSKSLDEKWRHNPWLWPDTDPAAKDVLSVISPNYRRLRRREMGKTEEEKEEDRIREEYNYIKALLGKGQAYFDAKTKVPKRRYSFGRFAARDVGRRLKRTNRRIRARAKSVSYSPSYYPSNLSAARLRNSRFASMSLHELTLLVRAAEIADDTDKGMLPREMPLEKPEVGSAHRGGFARKLANKSMEKISKRRSEIDKLESQLNGILNTLSGAPERNTSRSLSHQETVSKSSEATPQNRSLYKSTGVGSASPALDENSKFTHPPSESGRLGDTTAGESETPNETLELTNATATQTESLMKTSDKLGDTTTGEDVAANKAAEPTKTETSGTVKPRGADESSLRKGDRQLPQKAHSMSPSSFRLNVAELERNYQEENHHSSRSYGSAEPDRRPLHNSPYGTRNSDRRHLENTGELAPWEHTDISDRQRRTSQEMIDFALSAESGTSKQTSYTQNVADEED